jgi:ATP-dependent RNA helicase DeaD
LSPVKLADLSELMQAAVRRAGWAELLPVQQRTIPYLLASLDVMAQSRTGSGKTGAFLLPALERIDPNRPTTQVLILTPTRELARQIAHETSMLTDQTGIRNIAVYGGTTYQEQTAAFRKGAHIVTGTPGRILDHLLNGALRLDDLQLLIMDEADRMLSVGFYPDMKAVQRYLPKTHHIHTCMFSATYPPHVMRLAEEFLHEPLVISLSGDQVHVTNTEHVIYRFNGQDKDRELVHLIEMENPDSAIIFCNTRSRVNYVAVVLQRFGYDADQLSGDLQQSARERVLGRIRAGTLRFLVATDVAARGIDIPELSHVFQYEVPDNPEDYIHRAGRTGRAGASGTAVMFVDLLDTLKLGKIRKLYNIEWLEPDFPTEEQVAEMVSRRVSVLLKSRLRDLTSADRATLNQFEPMVEMMTTDPDGIRALAMLLDDFYQLRLHDPTLRAQQVTTPPADNSRRYDDTPLTPESMQKLALALADRLHRRDRLRLERIIRFEPLVEELSMADVDFHVLTMLLADFAQQRHAPHEPAPVAAQKTERPARQSADKKATRRPARKKW